jgi:hypothetical protein
MMACAYCGHRFLDSESRGVASFAPVGRLGRRRALRALRRELRRAGVRGHVVESAQRIHLPFWYLEAKLVGWQRYHRRRATVARVGEELVLEESGALELEEECFGHNVVHSSPACELREYGILGVAGKVQQLRLRPFQVESTPPGEMVCAVLSSRATVLRRARLYHAARSLPQGARKASQRVLLVRPRLRIIYYPVWRVRYRTHGQSFEAVIDGLQPTVLRGSGPRPEDDRFLPWLAAGGVAGLVAGVHPPLAAVASLAWAVARAIRDGITGRPGELAAWLHRQVGGRRLRPQSLGGSSRS